MNTKVILSCIMVLYMCSMGGQSRKLGEGGGGGNNNGKDTSKCLTELLPCQPFLNLTTKPTPVCCVPMKKVIAEEAECLCNLMHDPEVMKTFNTSMDDAVKLAKSCGANPDLSKCKNTNTGAAAGPAGSPSPSSSSGGGGGAGSGSPSTDSTPSADSSPSPRSKQIPNSVVAGFISLFLMALLAHI